MADNRQFFYNKLTSEMGLTPNQALGVLYSLQGESHTGLDSTAVGAGGDFGVAQWVGSRKAGLNAMAKSLGTDPTDPNTQWQFMKSELVGPYSHVLQGIRSAPDAATATNIWTTQYESPAVNNWQSRYNNGIKTTSLGGDNNDSLVLKGGNAAPVAASNTPPASGTTLNATGTTPPTQTPAQMLAAGNIGGAFQQMAKQGMPQQASQALSSAHQQQQIEPMQAPSLQMHRPDSGMAMQMLASLQNQGVKPPVAPQGAMSNQGMFGPMGMGMASGMYSPFMMGQGYV